MKILFRPQASSISKLSWFCYDTNNFTICAIYVHANMFGENVYVVNWFVDRDKMPEAVSMRGNRFLSFEEAERYVVETAPFMGYKLVGEHYRTLL